MTTKRRNYANVIALIAAATVAIAGVQAVNVAEAATTPPPPPLGSECGPPNDDAVTITKANRCIAELIRRSRTGLKEECLLDADAPGRTNPLYRRGDCKGTATGNKQPEAIAQARFIAWLNDDNRVAEPAPPTTGISPSVQWEVPHPKSGGPTGGQVDVMVYDRTSPAAGANGTPIDLVELKTRANGGETKAAEQMEDYLRDVPPGPANRPVNPYSFNAGYDDKFRLLVQDCGDPGVKTRVVYQYEVTSVNTPGVLVIKNPVKKTVPCPAPPEPEDDPGAPEVPDVDDGYPGTFPGPEDSDDAGPGIDFWQHYYDNHPELEPLELDMPTSDEPRSPGLVSWETGADIALDALLAACKAHKACKVADLARTIVVEGNKILVRPILNKLGELLGQTIGYRLYGDPHLATLDGFGYDLQSVGEFHLLELPEADIDVQARFVPAGPNASQTQWIATVINDHNVEIGPGGIRIDGTALSLPSGKLHALGEGASLSNTGVGYALTWPGTGPRMTMMYNNLNGGAAGFLLPPGVDYGPVQGLLGNHDGDPRNDLALRDGTPLASTTDAVTLHRAYADSWRVSDEESAFTYAAGESTATYTDRSMPQSVINPANLPADEVAAATETCAAAGVAPGPQFKACVFDVVVTGNTAYADAAALVTDVLIDPNGKAFNAQDKLRVDFEGATVPPNFVATRYSHDAATTRVAGPLFDGAGYRFSVREIGRHNGVGLDMDLLAYGPVTADGRDQSAKVTVNNKVLGQILFDGGPARLSDGFTGTLTVRESGTAADGRAFTRYRLQAPLGRTGEALDVELGLTNFKGVFNTSLAVDDIALDLDAPPAQHFAVTDPVVVGDQDITGPGAGAGTLDTPGAADSYDFEVSAASAGRPYAIQPMACTVALTFALTNRRTGAQAGRWANPPCSAATGKLIATPALDADPYTLTVTPHLSKADGSYALDLYRIPEPQTHAYPLNTNVRKNQPAQGMGNLETASSQDVYTFDAAAGGLYLDQRTCTTAQAWTLRTTAGEAIAGGTGCADAEIPNVAAGPVELVMATTGKRGGSYAFQLFATPVPPQEFGVSLPVTVTDQAPAAGAGNLENKQSTDRYTFTLGAAAPLYVDVPDCLPTGELAWKLFAAGSSTPAASGTCQGTQTGQLAAGEYRLDVSSTEEGYGAYAFQAWTVPMPPQTFPLTLPASIGPDSTGGSGPAPGAGNLETKASSDIYTFTIPDGKSELYLDGIDCSTPDMLRWQLIRTGTRIGPVTSNATVNLIADEGTCKDTQIRRLTQGDYQLVVTANGDKRGTYRLRIVASETGSPKIVHAPVPTAYYGKAVPIEAATGCQDPDKCFARLYYRTTAAGVSTPPGSWTRQDLSMKARSAAEEAAKTVSWTGAVPATVVTTTGVDYFITAGDGAHRNELPYGSLQGDVALGSYPDSAPAHEYNLYHHVSTVSPPLLTHVSPTVAQADTDLPLELKASCSTGDCTATLHYRTSTNAGIADLVADPGWPRITMTQTGALDLADAGRQLTYKATIPGSKIDTRGLDYYFHVTDTHTTGYWPGTTYQGYYAPLDGMRTTYQNIHVLEPPHIVHVAPPTTGYRAATAITATANCPATRTCTARLYYRTTTNTSDALADSALTEKDYDDAAMTVTQVSTLIGNDVIKVTGTIPASYADTRGIDYFFRVDDGSTTTWYPGTGQVQGYVNVDGTRVAFQHVRVLEPAHITHVPDLKTKALKPYTITSKMTCATENCTMKLHWRNDLAPGEAGPGWHTVTMTRTGAPVATPLGEQATYTATIPAAKVTTRGLAYYLQGHDGHVHDYSPGTSYWGAYLPMDGRPITGASSPGGATVEANGDGLTVSTGDDGDGGDEDSGYIGAYIVRVLEPPHLVHVPPGATEKGKPLTLSAASNCSSDACPATLTWTDNAGQKQTVDMTANKTVDADSLPAAVPGDVWEYKATIPAEDTHATVKYAISVSDGYASDKTIGLQTLVYQRPA